MDSDSLYLDIPLPYLSDAAAVETLDLLHALVLRFEVHYGGEINRYYKQRSCHHLFAPDPPEPTDPPF